MILKRRTFLKYAGVTGTTIGLGGLLSACGDSTTATSNVTGNGYNLIDPTNLANFKTPLNLPGSQGLLGFVDAARIPFSLNAKPEKLEIIKGKKTDLLTYQLNSADGKTVINPIFRLKTGDTFDTTLTNNLGEDTTVHWHGLSLDWRMDGHPSMPVSKGGNYRYTYTVNNRGGTYWYHPHPHKITARQAYTGLASFFIVEDEDNQRLNEALDLKLGETDLPLVIQDKLLDDKGQLVYPTDPTTQFMGLTGDTILVNLTPNPYLEVNSRLYRFRLLNGSNARTYRLAFIRSKGNAKWPYWLIGTDGGLLDKPYPVSELFLSPGERVEVLLELQTLDKDEVVTLKSLSFDPMHAEMGGMGNTGGMSGMGNMGGTMGTNSSHLEDGKEFNILKLIVKNKVSYTRTIPPTLSKIEAPNLVSSVSRPIVLSQSMGGGQSSAMMSWVINGKTFNMDEFPVTVKRNSREIWEFRNEALSMPHPLHLHGFQFRVVERWNSPAQLKSLATFEKGLVVTDLGWKDTVLVWPGETVKISLDFSHSFEGEQTYLAHCHVLEHEDNGMMFNYKVV